MSGRGRGTDISQDEHFLGSVAADGHITAHPTAHPSAEPRAVVGAKRVLKDALRRPMVCAPARFAWQQRARPAPPGPALCLPRTVGLPPRRPAATAGPKGGGGTKSDVVSWQGTGSGGQGKTNECRCDCHAPASHSCAMAANAGGGRGVQGPPVAAGSGP